METLEVPIITLNHVTIRSRLDRHKAPYVRKDTPPARKIPYAQREMRSFITLTKRLRLRYCCVSVRCYIKHMTKIG